VSLRARGSAFSAGVETGVTQTLKGRIMKLNAFRQKSLYKFKFLRTVRGPVLEHVLAYRFVDGLAPGVSLVTQANKLNAPIGRRIFSDGIAGLLQAVDKRCSGAGGEACRFREFTGSTTTVSGVKKINSSKICFVQAEYLGNHFAG
jgi:hypothetical protein